MSSDESCANCEFMRKHEWVDFSKEKHEYYACHRRPPVFVGDKGEALWPPVELNDWCGEWR